MASLAQLRAEHRELEKLAAQLLRVVVADVPDRALVAGMRWQIARALHTHCASEDEMLRAWLLASSDAAAGAAMRRYAEAELDLCEAFGRYIADWPLARMGQEWVAFRAATLAIAAKLADRISLEEQLLYPHVERLERRAA